MSDRPATSPASSVVNDPRFSAAELARRHRAARAAMDERGLGALLIYGAGRSAEVRYLVEWPGSRESFLVFPRDGDPTLLVQLNNHVPNARRLSAISDVRWAGARSAESVASEVASRGLSESRLGLVGGWPWRIVDALRARFPKLALEDSSDVIRDLRVIKSAEEMERLRVAARFTDMAMRALEAEARPGLREWELAAIVEASYAREGGTHGIHFMATTPMRAAEIGVPSQIQSGRAIERGDVLITEISAEWAGYTGQIHRAYAIGAEPTVEFQRVHDAAVETYERIVAVLQDGATVANVLDAAEVVHDRGFTLYDDLLHGASQLPPIIQTRRTRRLPFDEAFTFRENMVVVVQPNVTTDESGRVGLQVGETLRITKAGVERLHDYPMRFIMCAQ